MSFQSDLAAFKMRLALLRLMLKYNFNPAQPRVRAGSAEGEQWTGVAGGWGRVAGNSRTGNKVVSDSATALVPPKSPPHASVDENIALA